MITITTLEHATTTNTINKGNLAFVAANHLAIWAYKLFTITSRALWLILTSIITFALTSRTDPFTLLTKRTNDFFLTFAAEFKAFGTATNSSFSTKHSTTIAIVIGSGITRIHAGFVIN